MTSSNSKTPRWLLVPFILASIFPFYEALSVYLSDSMDGHCLPVGSFGRIGGACTFGKKVGVAFFPEQPHLGYVLLIGFAGLLMLGLAYLIHRLTHPSSGSLR